MVGFWGDREDDTEICWESRAEGKIQLQKSKGRHDGVPNQKARSGMETEQRI